MNASAMTKIDRAEAEAFLGHEARLLEDGKFVDWLALFTQDCWYWVPIERNQQSPDDMVSLMYDDRRLLETRVRRLTQQHPHAFTPPSHTSRLISNVTVEEEFPAEGAVLVRSKFVMVEARHDKQRVFAGTCLHKLVKVAGQIHIASKRVDLVNCDAMHDGLVQPF
jgi:3-phenylpropionate/cinnamic acid dioxygenase small subunit